MCVAVVLEVEIAPASFKLRFVITMKNFFPLVVWGSRPRTSVVKNSANAHTGNICRIRLCFCRLQLRALVGQFPTIG